MNGGRPDPAGGRVRSFAALARTVLAAPARLGPVRLVAVDGRAGSGKTTFARRLAAAVRAEGAATAEVHTDDLLEGWTDMVSFWPRLERQVLAPLAEGRPGGYHSYDWVAARFRSELVEVPVPDVLVVEGVTSARAEVRGRLTRAVRVLAGREVRLARGIERDGPELLAEWERWMAAEDRHFAADPGDPADLVVDGAPVGLRHDPEREYVVAAGDDAGEAPCRAHQRG